MKNVDRQEEGKKIIGLAIESATKTASVALIEDGEIIAEMTLNGRLNHSETLVPMIDDVCRVADFDVKDLDFIAVSKGPGSYTGLRIGISVAKGIARVAGAKIVGVSTLESLAMNGHEGMLVCPMMDARRKHAYCAAYHIERNEALRTIIKPELRSVEDFAVMVDEVFAKVKDENRSNGELPQLFAKVNTESENGNESIQLFAKVHYLGDGTVSHRELLLEHARGDFILGSDRENTPFASVLALIGYERFKNGEGVRYSEFTPDYFRTSQAKRMLGSK